MKKLILPALQNFLIGIVALGVVIFLPAWTLNYWQAWVFIVVFNACVMVVGLWLSLNDPALLEKRKKFGPAQETNPAQKAIMGLGLVGVLGMLVVPALDHRFGWAQLPGYVSLAGDALVALGLYINLLTFKENSFGGSTIEIFEGQQVISSGPYGLVRHPMYAGVLVMCAGVPLALGSAWGLVVLLVLLPVLIWRIMDEEKLLRKDLPGYTEYAQRVRYRLVPGLW